jgi:hypothetical protein
MRFKMAAENDDLRPPSSFKPIETQSSICLKIKWFWNLSGRFLDVHCSVTIQNRTGPLFKWSISAGTWHPNIGPLKTGQIFPVLKWSVSLD